MQIVIVVVSLLAGGISGYFRLPPDRFEDYSEYVVHLGLFVLLASMGIKIGMDKQLWGSMDRLGLQAVAISVTSILGSVLLLHACRKVVIWSQISSGSSVDLVSGDGTGNHRTSLFIFISLLVGLGGGHFFFSPGFSAYLHPAINSSLGLLLLGVGYSIGLKRETLSRAREFGWRLMLIPLAVAVGSILGPCLISSFIGLGARETAAVSAGFGWYSLSGVLLTRVHSLELGSLAFLSNVFRELIAILVIPLIVQFLGRVAAIAPGGATTMDVTLPVIKKVVGDDAVIPAFLSGAVLTGLVPLLVPFLAP